MLLEEFLNFCIIKPSDLGKSRRTERLLRLTSTTPDQATTDQGLGLKDLGYKKNVAIKPSTDGRMTWQTYINALGKGAISRCCWGDATRNPKMLVKQKVGEVQLIILVHFELPQKALLSVLRSGDDE